MKLGVIDQYIEFLCEPWHARLATIAANIWRGVPFVAICLLAGLQTISPSYYEAASLDGATGWQQLRHVTLPLLAPITAVVMTFSVLFTFTDFQLIYRAHARRAAQRDAPDGHAVVPSAPFPGGYLGEGCRDREPAMVPFLLGAIMFSYFGLQRQRLATGWGGPVSEGTSARSELRVAAGAQAMDYPGDDAQARGHGLLAVGRLPVRAAVPSSTGW